MVARAQEQSAASLSWKPHTIKQGDGQGGWVQRPSEYRFLHHKPVGKYLFPFGVIQMDNGELLLAASWNDGTSEKARIAEKSVVALSRDRGDTWSDFAAVPAAIGRPVMLTDFGRGNVTFQTDPLGPFLPTQHFSKDYGRTWNKWQTLQPAANGGTYDGTAGEGFFGTEGNALVDRDSQGAALRVAQVGWNFDKGNRSFHNASNGILRWSADGGRTWTNETMPPAWRFGVDFQGKSFPRGISEGSLVRAANGWIVAALRTDVPARYLDVGSDNVEGVGVSLSKDDGKTWSPVKPLYDSGRMHAHLLRLPSGDIVMTLIVRSDVRDGTLASYRRGIEAIVSHDHGQSWDIAHKYILDEYEFYDGVRWSNGKCGHLSSALLDDGSILSCYANYLSQGGSLIRWKLHEEK